MDFKNGLDIDNLTELPKGSSEVPQETLWGVKKPRGRKKGYKRSPEEIAKMIETRKKNKIVMEEPKNDRELDRKVDD